MESWDIQEVSDDSIDFQLSFTSVESVSISRKDRDRIEFKLLKPELFTGVYSKKKLLSTDIPEIFVPKQIDLTSAETVEAVESVQTGAIKAFVTGNLVVSIPLSLSLG